MTLSAEDVRAVQIAHRQIQEFRRRRKWVWCWIAGELAGVWFLKEHFTQTGRWGDVILVVLCLKMFRDWVRFKRLSLLFPTNIQRLQRLRESGVDVRTVLKR